MSGLEHLTDEQNLQLKEHEACFARLEAEKLTQGALHKAAVEDLTQQLNELRMQEREKATAQQLELEGMKASLAAMSIASKEAAIEAEQQHAAELASRDKAFEQDTSELDLKLKAWVSAYCTKPYQTPLSLCLHSLNILNPEGIRLEPAVFSYMP